MKMDLSGLSAAELDALIAEAAQRRAAMEPKVASQPPATLEAQVNPAWSVSLVEQGSLLRIRHPGLGWIGLILPATERAILLSALLQHALISKPEVKLTIKPAGEVAGGSVH